VALLDSQCTVISVGRNVTFIVPQSVFGTNQVGEVGTKLSKTFINIPAGVRGQDKLGNTIALMSQVNSIQAGTQLVKFLLDMNLGLITLVFTSAVDRGTFDPIKLGFYSLASGQSIFLSSSTGSTLRPPALSVPARPVSQSVALLTLGSTDLNNLKSIVPLERFIYIIILENALNDTQGSPVVPRLLTDNFFILPSVIYPDTVSPLIISITLDMGLDVLTIELNEPANLGSISITGFRIQSTAVSKANSRLLTDGIVSTNGTIVAISFSKKDEAILKITAGLAKDLSTSYLSLDFKPLSDIAGNFLATILDTNARQVDVYIADTIRPFLSTTFGLDMTLNILTLIFSEPVRSNFNITSITLQPSFLSVPAMRLQLTGGIVTFSSDETTVFIKLNELDIFHIKNIPFLARSGASTFLTATTTAAEDTSFNPLIPILNGISLACNSFTPNTALPTIISAAVNMNAFTVAFTLSDIVVQNEVVASGISFQTEFNSSLISGSLTTSSGVNAAQAITNPFNAVVIIQVCQTTYLHR
jgi:hypothetical protein